MAKDKVKGRNERNTVVGIGGKRSYGGRERPVLSGKKKKVGGGRSSCREDPGDKDEKAGDGG